MSIIKYLDKRFNQKLGYKEQWVLFECELCKKQVEKPKNIAIKIKYCKICGNKIAGQKRIIHGGAKRGKEDKLYTIWRGMKDRCYGITNKSNKIYKEKGVLVCSEWKNSYIAFKKWALENGYKPGLHLDKDELSKKLDIYPPIYSSKTCQWVTQQKNNYIENLLNSSTIEYQIVKHYQQGLSITELANKYYNGKGKSKSAPTKYIEGVLRRYNIYKPKIDKTPISNKLIKLILKDPKPLKVKLKEHKISYNKWKRNLSKYENRKGSNDSF